MKFLKPFWPQASTCSLKNLQLGMQVLIYFLWFRDYEILDLGVAKCWVSILLETLDVLMSSVSQVGR